MGHMPNSTPPTLSQPGSASVTTGGATNFPTVMDEYENYRNLTSKYNAQSGQSTQGTPVTSRTGGRGVPTPGGPSSQPHTMTSTPNINHSSISNPNGSRGYPTQQQQQQQQQQQRQFTQQMQRQRSQQAAMASQSASNDASSMAWQSRGRMTAAQATQAQTLQNQSNPYAHPPRSVMLDIVANGVMSPTSSHSSAMLGPQPPQPQVSGTAGRTQLSSGPSVTNQPRSSVSSLPPQHPSGSGMGYSAEISQQPSQQPQFDQGYDPYPRSQVAQQQLQTASIPPLPPAPPFQSQSRSHSQQQHPQPPQQYPPDSVSTSSNRFGPSTAQMAAQHPQQKRPDEFLTVSMFNQFREEVAKKDSQLELRLDEMQKTQQAILDYLKTQ
ncbi:hypothetical protein KEM56_004354 [Ascosphaera pollenicola]|nr:hypothetical protein KEM56_004354 [Ascosphaera pollenicola]